jgi:hypothetical protein
MAKIRSSVRKADHSMSSSKGISFEVTRRSQQKTLYTLGVYQSRHHVYDDRFLLPLTCDLVGLELISVFLTA